jgi:hypothetical protein
LEPYAPTCIAGFRFPLAIIDPFGTVRIATALYGFVRGLSVGNDPTYNNTTCFETFPLPWPPGSEPTEDTRYIAICGTAKELSDLRETWLHSKDISTEELTERTLTNLYNKFPNWLSDAHRKLDETVLAAYGWPSDSTEDDILSRLLVLNKDRKDQIDAEGRG